MGNFVLTVPQLGSNFVDYRNPILGDSYNWHWVRPMSQVRYLAIHHTAGPDTQTPDDIAAYHVNSRGWGGIGYHFVIDKSGKVFYVGDLTTARANVYNYNHLVIGICLIGSFIDGRQPTNAQINSTHHLCSRLLFQTPELPGTDGWEDVIGHKGLGSTRCPGDDWDNWRAKIINGISAPTPPNQANRRQQIVDLYKVVLGRDPDQGGLDHYLNGNLTIDQIRKAMTESQEHSDIINKAKSAKNYLTMAHEALNEINQARMKVEQIIQS